MKRFAHHTTELLRHVLAGTLAALLALGPAPRAFADVKSSDPRVVQNVNNAQIWDITFKNGAIIRYSSFDVGKTQTANFISKDGANARVLNRINSATPTMIDGKITGSGRIYIVNPAGVFFGSTAQVNVTQLQAAAGNLSDRDFKASRDHYTNLSGTVSNAAAPSADNPDAGIVANAVALVGRNVQNSGAIDTHSWIIMAAGRDVFIGQDPDGTNGLLLRVEGGADAVFDKKAVGVTNTGTLSAVNPPTPPGQTDPPPARISLGAGDLYGTAIFNTGAIQAREVALQASNKGDVALGGEVQADKLGVTFGGDQSGKLVAAGGSGAGALKVDELDLRATGAKGQVVVANPFTLSNQTTRVNVEQKATLTASNLANLGLGGPEDRKETEVGLKSTTSIDLDDKTLVTGTRLTLDAPTVKIRGVSDPLVVDRLNLESRLTDSESDLVATGTDLKLPDDGDPNTPIDYQAALRIGGNLQMDTKPGAAGGPELGAKLSALNGTVSSVGDVVTSDGGGLRIEAADVKLGTVSDDGSSIVGGSILSSGKTVSRLTIVADNHGNAGEDAHLKGSVQANSILTNAAVQIQGVAQTEGGDVAISAKQGDLHIFGDVLTTGGAPRQQGDPQQAGGSVHLDAAQTLTVRNITTGGADAPTGSEDVERADIHLSGSTGIVVNGNLSARAADVDNKNGERDRTIELDGPVTLGADEVSIAGGPVTVTGHIKEGQKLSDPNDPNSAMVDRKVALTISSGPVTLGGGADLESLRISTRGPDPSVVFGGDVTADKFVDLTFVTDAVGHWETAGSGPVSVHAPEILVGNDPNSTGGGVDLDKDLKLDLKTIDPNEPNLPTRPSFTFSQNRSIDPLTMAMLFGDQRFTGGVEGKAFSLITTSAMTLSQDSANALAKSNVDLVADSFTAVPAAGKERLSFDVQSFKLTTLGGLDADLDVTATGTADDQGIGLQSGAATSGPGNLTVKGNYNSHAILLAAGDGVTDGGRTDGFITVDPTAQFRNADGSSHPDIFGLAQDASLSSDSLPGKSQFGGSVERMEVRLESDDGSVTLDPAKPDLYTGTSLVLDGATGVSLGSSPLVLSGLTARSRTDLSVSQDVTVSRTDGKDGVISLVAGNATGSGNLTVDAKLSADSIELVAGKGDGVAATSRVILGNDALFAGGSPQQPNPKHFSLTQDATLAATGQPSRANFAKPDADPNDPNSANLLAGMELGLRSLGGSLTVTDLELIRDTKLTLEGKTGVDLQLKGADLPLASLDEKGAMTLDGGLATADALSIDGALTLDKAIDAQHPSGDQLLTAGGALTITGKTTKTTAGSIGIGSTDPDQGIGGDVTIGDVATNHTGGSILIHGNTSVTTGQLDASGTPPVPSATEPDPLAVWVTANGAVDVAGINTSGKTGATGQTGSNGGDVLVVGDSLRVGTINTSGGAGGVATPLQETTRGGNAGSIELTATGSSGEIGILGDLLAAGGVGNRRDQDTPLGPLIGAAGDVSVNGSLLLLADNAVTGHTNTIRGKNVLIGGDIAPGTETLDDANTATPIDPRSTGLTVAAKGTLTVAGDSLRTGRLDLEAQTGDLDVAGKTIFADEIRLAATDGAGPTTNTGSTVDIAGTTFHASDWDGDKHTRRIVSLTLEQDAGFGAGASPIPNKNDFKGTSEPNEPALALGLISQDGRVVLGPNDLGNVAGTRLTLASNAVTPTGVDPIEIDAPGQTLELEALQLGSVLGAVGANGSNKVGGNTMVNGNLRLEGLGLDEEALRAYGDLTVHGDAHVIGRGSFTGDGPQKLHVDGDLELGGTQLGKSTNGSFTVEAQQIDLTAPVAQTISNDSGQLLVGGALVKDRALFHDLDGDGALDLDPNAPPRDPNGDVAVGRSLTLIGVSEDANAPAVKVSGTTEIVPGTGRFAIAVANGNILISAQTRAPGTSKSTIGRYELDGDVLAFGDIELDGEGSFLGTQDTTTISALHNPFSLGGGELSTSGVKSANGNLHLVADGDNPSEDVPHPSAIHLEGNFAGLSGGLELDGTVDFAKDTTIDAAKDVSFDAEVQGDKNLTVTSGGTIALGDDVTLTAGALSLAGKGGVHFTSTNDTQFIRADSLSFGSKATQNKSGAATLVRDGNLTLTANKGNVAMGSGQRMVVNGSLDVSAPNSIILGDTAALRISLVSHDLTVRAGATVMGNSIVASASPVVTGGGIATFAVPTRTELSDRIPNKNILIRQIHPDGSPLSFDADFASGDVFFPPANGPAQFDFAEVTPRPPLRYPLTRPRVDVFELDAALANRPLWADELLAYLEARSTETPGVAPAVEHLPPVGARPGDALGPADRRVRSAAAEQAVALYREVFRPDVARNPETGYLDGPGKAAAIRAAFQAPVDALRHGNRGEAVSGTALRNLIEGNSAFAAASSYRSQLDQLLAAGELALTPDQKARFRALLLSEVTPYGIGAAEFASAIQ